MRKIIIDKNYWQTRIAVTTGEKLQNIYFHSPSVKTIERVYFKGIITKVLPGIQTAFVDIGQEKAGFLHISEIDRELAFERLLEEKDDKKTRARGYQKTADISKILKEGEEILVQVSKEPIYEKGAKLTTCFTLPGRFIVLMPNISRIGISKKIEDREERARLKELIRNNLPDAMGAIIRTTSENRKKKDLAQDIRYLMDTWEEINKKFKTAQPKEKLHEDLPMPLRVVRDHLDDDVSAIIINEKKEQKEIYKFVKHIAAEHSHKVKFYTEPPPIFEKFNIEKQIEQAVHKKVNLRSGGSLIIETTEAMTVIDVNTGKFVGKKKLDDTILKTNLEAAQEVARQLRLRNIGGLIVIDFIDMAPSEHRKQLIRLFEKTLRETDKFQSVVLKVSEFGLVQMTRKRSGKTLVQQITETCPCCSGSGNIKSVQTESYAILRDLKKDFQEKKPIKSAELTTSQAVFDHITSIEYDSILQLEKDFGCSLTLSEDKNFTLNQYKIEKT
ncbi:Rne/Rng family ribonuclease [Candidatus Dependentiae bacterium]